MIDLIGKKFGRLTAIKKVGSTKWGSINWLCKCECGKEKIIDGRHLRDGNTRSCGCLGKETMEANFVRMVKKRKLEPGLANMRRIILNYKTNAKNRGLKYKLTEEQFKKITQKDCYYCGAKPNNISKQNRYTGSYIYNGLDRIDNAKGYTINNVVPCCKICNIAKHNLTLQEYQNWIKKSYNRLREMKDEIKQKFHE
ncbi:hypothetical protein ES705_20758 [subsurface metagenome]